MGNGRRVAAGGDGAPAGMALRRGRVAGFAMTERKLAKNGSSLVQMWWREDFSGVMKLKLA